MANTNEQDNIAKVNEFARVFSSGDIPAIVAALHPEARYWISGTIDGMSGWYSPTELGQLLSGVAGTYKHGALEVTPQSAIAQGDRVAVEAEGFAELVDGRVYKPKYHFLFVVRNGEIVEVKEYFDTHHAYETFYA